MDLFPTKRHSWEKISYERAVCRCCGMVRVHVTDGEKHRNEYFRGEMKWTKATPDCDGSIPEGWIPPRAKSIFYEGESHDPTH